MSSASDSATSVPALDEEAIAGSRLALLFWVVGLVAQAPLFLMFVTAQWRYEHYRHLPFLMVAMLVLAWLRIKPPLRLPSGKFVIGVLMAAVVCTVVGSIANSTWFGSIGFALFATSFFVTHRAPYLIAIALMFVRLPLGLDLQIVALIETLATRLSSYLLDLLFVPNLIRQGAIKLAESELIVPEISRGTLGFFLIASFAVLLGAWRRRPVTLLPAYLLMAFAWTVLIATLRLTAIAYATDQLELDLANSTASIVLELALVLIALFLTWSADAMLSVIFHPVSLVESDEYNPFISAWEWLFVPEEDINYMNEEAAIGSSQARRWRLALIALGVIGLMSFAPLISYAVSTPPPADLPTSSIVAAPDEEISVTDSPLSFSSIPTDDQASQAISDVNQTIWVAKLGDSDYDGSLTLSQPFYGWNDRLPEYLRDDEWRLGTMGLLDTLGDESTEDNIKIMKFNSINKRFGYLVSSGFDDLGESLVPPPVEAEKSLLQRSLARGLALFDVNKKDDGERRASAMLQLWIVSDEELSDDTVLSIADTLVKIRNQFVFQIKSNPPAMNP